MAMIAGGGTGGGRKKHPQRLPIYDPHAKDWLYRPYCTTNLQGTNFTLVPACRQTASSRSRAAAVKWSERLVFGLVEGDNSVEGGVPERPWETALKTVLVLVASVGSGPAAVYCAPYGDCC